LREEISDIPSHHILVSPILIILFNLRLEMAGGMSELEDIGCPHSCYLED